MKKKIFFYAIPLVISVFLLGFMPVHLFQDQQPVTLADYNRITLAKDKKVLVYFHASWCTVCPKIKPLIDQAEADYKGKMEGLRVDTDRDKAVVKEFEVDALPVLILYHNGNRQWINVGIIDKSKLKEMIENY
jgi:thioredoxin 1